MKRWWCYHVTALQGMGDELCHPSVQGQQATVQGSLHSVYHLWEERNGRTLLLHLILWINRSRFLNMSLQASVFCLEMQIPGTEGNLHWKNRGVLSLSLKRGIRDAWQRKQRVSTDSVSPCSVATVICQSLHSFLHKMIVLIFITFVHPTLF